MQRVIVLEQNLYKQKLYIRRICKAVNFEKR
jgi:hypothetical protein